jgi:hypothetical protein
LAPRGFGLVDRGGRFRRRRRIHARTESAGLDRREVDKFIAAAVAAARGQGGARSLVDCAAPALNEFNREFRERGLQVIGFYHHKSPGSLEVEAVKEHARRLGFEFPIAIDFDWRTLKQWWLHSEAEKWTSVSFLLDRQGVVRYIHPGGQYVKGDPDYQILRSKIEELLEGR